MSAREPISSGRPAAQFARGDAPRHEIGARKKRMIKVIIKYQSAAVKGESFEPPRQLGSDRSPSPRFKNYDEATFARNWGL